MCYVVLWQYDILITQITCSKQLYIPYYSIQSTHDFRTYPTCISLRTFFTYDISLNSAAFGNDTWSWTHAPRTETSDWVLRRTRDTAIINCSEFCVFIVHDNFMGRRVLFRTVLFDNEKWFVIVYSHSYRYSDVRSTQSYVLCIAEYIMALRYCTCRLPLCVLHALFSVHTRRTIHTANAFYTHPKSQVLYHRYD